MNWETKGTTKIYKGIKYVYAFDKVSDTTNMLMISSISTYGLRITFEVKDFQTAKNIVKEIEK